MFDRDEAPGELQLTPRHALNLVLLILALLLTVGVLVQMVAVYPGLLITEFGLLLLPTLLLWGRQDHVVPVFIGERLRVDLPRARLEVLDECGHIPHEERPTASLEMLEAFLSRP